MDKIIKHDIEKLNYAYAKATTKSSKKKIVDDLFNFSTMCHEKFLIDDEFLWEREENLVYLSEYSKGVFRRNVLEKKDTYLKIADSVIDSFIEVSFPFYKKDIDKYREYHRLSEKDMFEIILSFLNTFDSSLLKTFRDKVNDGNLYLSSVEEEDSYGATCEFSFLKKNIMFVNSENDGSSSIRVAATIMHEFGHTIEMDLYNKTGIKNNMYLYPFYEVCSHFTEYAFLNYLLENKIYLNDVKLYQRIYFMELFHFILGMSLFSEVKKDGECEYSIDSDALEEKERIIQEKINCYTMTNSDIEDFDNSYVYGLGYLFSPYLYENYKNDPKMFMHEFKNALLTYPYTNSIEAFDKVGVSQDKLIEGSILKRVLKNNR